jgi:ABC-type sugar transport system ATPase subunit
VNVLIGENGAGKSTLMRILAGVEQADEGQLLMDSQPITLRSPRDASAHGISIVHQELAVLPNLDISENIFAGRELTRGVFVNRGAEDIQSNEALSIDSRYCRDAATVGSLRCVSTGKRSRECILRTPLMFAAKTDGSRKTSQTSLMNITFSSGFLRNTGFSPG